MSVSQLLYTVFIACIGGECMKILFYNLGYARGHVGSPSSYLLKANRFVHQSVGSQTRVLNEVLDLVEKEQPDVFSYAEIMTGSFRNQYFNQHQYLLTHLRHRSVADAALSKYGETMLNFAPFHTGNCNGVITFLPARITEYYLAKSRKKLVFIIKLDTVTIFTVHLPLVSADRRAQLEELSHLVNSTPGDAVVCGDFNIFGGLDELAVLQQSTDLTVAGNQEPTCPSAAPKIQLDVFLYRLSASNGSPKLTIPTIHASDHLPVLFEY